jgi:asparagine synthase (glutamine-hydrolysing)
VCGMVEALALRGPDGHGLEAWPGAVLGHCRLSIFDLSEAGRQPMASRDRRIGVVFNGAIYNFLVLRAELEGKGHEFCSQCDTEVLVEGYAEWGIDGLVRRLRGMFAFAVWDSRQQKLFLVRDRLGVKPLVYAENKDGLAFASTLSALRQGGFAEEVNPDAILDFLEFGWVTESRTIYSEARKLPPATILEWHRGRTCERRYWAPPPPRGTLRRFADVVEEAEAAIMEAVQLRLYADVPVGALLSAGIDSALVCWAMAKLNGNIRSFTIRTPGDLEDESSDASRTARILGIPHEIIDLPASDQPDLCELISAYDEPFASASALGMLRVSKAVRDKVTVLLTGDGGDDVFLGYPRHLHLWYAQRLARALPAQAAAAWPVVRGFLRHLPGTRRPAHFLDYAMYGLGSAAPVHNGLGVLRRMGSLGDRLSTRLLPTPDFPKSLQSGRNVLSDFLSYEWKTQFVAEYLKKVDGATMFHALEARSPFLDQSLWEFASALPYEVRLRGGEMKAVLRAVVRKNLGREVSNRKKKGFNIPVNKWLVTSWRRHLMDLQDGTALEKDNWIAPGSLQSIVRRTVMDGNAPDLVWRLLVLEHWLQFSRERRREGTAAVLGS